MISTPVARVAKKNAVLQQHYTIFQYSWNFVGLDLSTYLHCVLNKANLSHWLHGPWLWNNVRCATFYYSLCSRFSNYFMYHLTLNLSAQWRYCLQKERKTERIWAIYKCMMQCDNERHWLNLFILGDNLARRTCRAPVSHAYPWVLFGIAAWQAGI